MKRGDPGLLVSILDRKWLMQDYPGIIRGVRKNKSSWDVVVVLVRRKRCPMSGKLPTRGTWEMSTRCEEMMIPPTTTVPPSLTVTLVSADCVFSAGIPC